MGRMQRLFVWEGLPYPQRELENLLLTSGFCSQVESTKFLVSKVGVTPCTYSGVTEYQDIGTKVTWTTPVASGSFNLNTNDGILIRLVQPINIL